jgi:SEFIR domain
MIAAPPAAPVRKGAAALSEPATPRVLISYSHDGPAHDDRVLALADRLRADGIDAMIDLYEPFPPEGWPRGATVKSANRIS